MTMQFDFSGKVALITGGNSGIGRACALLFASAGAEVVITARRVEQGEAVVNDILSRGGKAHFISADMQQLDSIPGLIENIVQTAGRIDFAVNNAGMLGPVNTAFEDYSLASFNQVMTVNVKAVFVCMQVQLKHMAAQASGSIINVSSIAGLKAGRASCAYTASKHALVGLTRAAAKEYASQGVRVNAICPGLISTPMTVDAKYYNGKPVSQAIPVGRMGQVEEVAAAVGYLCADQSAFVTGVALPLDGGLTV